MSALKDFFNKMKKDKKFRVAGPGHSLTDNTDRPSVQARPAPPKPSAGPGLERRVGSSEGSQKAAAESQQKAAQAALARLEQRMGGMGKSTNLLKEVFTEMGYSKIEVEAGSSSGGSTAQLVEKVNEATEHPVLAVEGVFYKCSVIGPFVLPRDEMERKIQEFLVEQFTVDPAIASAVMLVTFNKDLERLQVGKDTLNKYLENIVGNPEEEKYRRIRIQNKAFQERVMSLDCADKFLEAAGFQKIPLPVEEGKEEDFYLLFPDHVNIEKLNLMRDYLMQAEPIVAELDRGIRVFRPSGNVASFNLPDGFYDRTAEEIQEEYKRRQEELERNSALRTKAMREREQPKSSRKYRFTVLRVRIPGPDTGFVVQGTFGAYEKISAVEEFIRENLMNEQLPFILTTAVGNKLTNPDARLIELELVPAAIMNFQSLLPAPPSGKQGDIPFLKPETVALARNF